MAKEQSTKSDSSVVRVELPKPQVRGFGSLFARIESVIGSPAQLPVDTLPSVTPKRAQELLRDGRLWKDSSNVEADDFDRQALRWHELRQLIHVFLARESDGDPR